MIRIGICDDLVEQLQIQEEMVRNIVCRLQRSLVGSEMCIRDRDKRS